MYGLIGSFNAQPGKRDELIGYLLAGTDKMPGNLAYMINKDAADPDAIWIVEVWIDKAAHTASLSLPVKVSFKLLPRTASMLRSVSVPPKPSCAVPSAAPPSVTVPLRGSSTPAGRTRCTLASTYSASVLQLPYTPNAPPSTLPRAL